MPSTGSIFAKPVKRCFTAPKGKVICSIDFASLEDKIIANLSNDQNKIITQTDPSIDAHLFHATIYFKAEFEQILGKGLSHRDLTIQAKEAMDNGNKRVKELRQLSKSVTFGASYGAFPPKIASSIKCSLEEAETIFNAYHNDMYPGITNYRENYILPTSRDNGELHLGLGFKIITDDANKDIRTLANSSIQFWSILALLTINKMHQLIDANNLQDDILITSTIYDSIFFEVTADANIIKWLNDTIVPIMTQDFMPGQVVLNDCDLCVGNSWADYDDNKLNQNAPVGDIQKILEKLQSPQQP
jgi:DNA polymerase-1